MNDQLLHAKKALLNGATYAEAAKGAGLKHSVDLHAALKEDPDVVAAKAAGIIKTRRAPTRSPLHYAKKAHVRAVLEQGMTHTEAAKKFGVSQPLVSRHVKLALDEYKQEDSPPPLASPFNREPPPPPTPPTQDPEIAAISTLITAYAQRHNLTTANVLDNLASLLQSGTR